MSSLPEHEPDLAATRIYATVDCIPRGRVATYGQIAGESGLPRRARLVGSLLARLGKANDLPWHRVVNASGRISDRSGSSPRVQRQRLEAENVEFDERGRIDLARYSWRP